ncbi:protein transport protein S31 [Savitreella phatthalungensis]
MVRLRDISVKGHLAWSPKDTTLAVATLAGSLNDDLSDDAKLELYELDGGDEPAKSITLPSKAVSLAWAADKIAVALDDGKISFHDGKTLKELFSGTHATARAIQFNPIQDHLLVSAGSRGEFLVWDTNKKGSTTSYKSTRIDEIASIAWNRRVAHILALGGRSGALSVWDLKKKSELIHIATRYAVNAIAWHPTEATLLAVASGDDGLIQVWDLRNANTPRSTFRGHEKAVLSLAWCQQDPDLLLSSGADNRTLMWNPQTGEQLAELPISSQWVNQVAWCPSQPQLLANNALDGRISIYTIQDVLAKETDAPVHETPAGDDFFDSIPRNYQAQTASFTIKQAPKWLKRPISATFGDCGRLVKVSGSKLSFEVYPTGETAATALEKSEGVWDEATEAVVETLSSEKPRDALMSYLGHSRELPEADESGEDAFSAIVQKPSFDGSFHLFDKQAFSSTDAAITEEILKGRFDKAIDLCLGEDRLSDAFMLALCGGQESQVRVRNAYLSKTDVPYRRLLNSVIAGDLTDLVENADLAGWRETLVAFCNYAKPADFSTLCTRLGERLDGAGKREDATICFLAGADLGKLTTIWLEQQEASERDNLKSGSGNAFELHVAALATVVKKAQAFRKAVSFSDDRRKIDGKYALAALYDRYLEFAHLLAAEGRQDAAKEYLSLVPADYSTAKALTDRLQPRAKSQQSQQQQQNRGPYATASRPAPLQPTVLPPSPYGRPQVPAVSSPAGPVAPQSAPTQATASAPRSQYAPAYAPAQAAAVPGPAPALAPTQTPAAYAPAGASPYAPARPAVPAAPSQFGRAAYQPPSAYAYGQPRPPPSGPTMLPAANRKDITPWNDAPELDPAPSRRATPAVVHAGIATPFAGTPGVQTPPPGPTTGLPPPPRPAQQQLQPQQQQHYQQQQQQQQQQFQQQIPQPQQQQTYQSPPPSVPTMRAVSNPVAPPPISTAPPPTRNPLPPPPKGASRAATVETKESPTIRSAGGAFALSREPSQQGFSSQENGLSQQVEKSQQSHPPGTRDHIPAEDRPIFEILSGEITRVLEVAPEKYRRPLNDSARRLETLFDALNNRLLSASTLERLRQLSAHVAAKDYGPAYKINMELTASAIEECRDWITGVKTLITVAKIVAS